MTQVLHLVQWGVLVMNCGIMRVRVLRIKKIVLILLSKRLLDLKVYVNRYIKPYEK